MEYVMLMYTNEAQAAKLPAEETKQVMGAYFAFTDGVKAGGQYVTGRPLQPTQTATTVRVEGGQILTSDGPFAETKEQLAGFYILKCKDLDEAIALAAKIPAASSGRIEIRPTVVFG